MAETLRPVLNFALAMLLDLTGAPNDGFPLTRSLKTVFTVDLRRCILSGAIKRFVSVLSS